MIMINYMYVPSMIKDIWDEFHMNAYFKYGRRVNSRAGKYVWPVKILRRRFAEEVLFINSSLTLKCISATPHLFVVMVLLFFIPRLVVAVFHSSYITPA